MWYNACVELTEYLQTLPSRGVAVDDLPGPRADVIATLEALGWKSVGKIAGKLYYSRPGLREQIEAELPYGVDEDTWLLYRAMRRA